MFTVKLHQNFTNNLPKQNLKKLKEEVASSRFNYKER